ncbi:lanthionine synthetase LanC family protein [Clostridium acetobutylicum]|nr:lanthionine synthetase LanC family protein [Clostridium acetobutylicum]
MELKSIETVGDFISLSGNSRRLTSILKVKRLIRENYSIIRSNLLNTEDKVAIKEIKYYEKEERAIVTFTDNEKVVFQSYISKDEEIINKFIRWINQKVDKEHSLYVKKILYAEGCSFSEYIKPINSIGKREIFDYYFKSGELLLILYVLRCSKIKSKNIIDMEDCPILDEVKDAFYSTNDVPSFNFSANEVAEKLVKYSVYNIEFLPESKKSITEEEIYHIKCGFEYIYNMIMYNKLELIEVMKVIFKEDILKLSAVITNIYGLNEEDLKRQLYFIDIRFIGVKIARRKVNFCISERKETIDKNYFISIANDLGEHMIKRGIIGVKDFVTSRTWISTTRDGNNQGYSLSPLSSDLMDGSSGVALFFAYLGLVTGKDYYKAIAIEAIQDSINHINNLNNNDDINIGAFKGISGEIYAMWKIYSVTRSNYLEASIENGIRALYILVQKSKDIDITNGLCGVSCVLVSIYKDKDSNKFNDIIMNLIRICMEKITGNMSSKQMALNDVYLNDAIILTLAKLLELTGERSLVKKIKELFSIQRMKYKDIFARWDRRILITLMGRVTLKKINFQDESIDREIQQISKYIINNGFGNSFSCCDDMGIIEVLKHTAAILSDEKLNSSCIKTFNELVKKKIKPTINKEITYANENISLMNGVVGLAYSLIRISSEKFVPKILWLE